MFDEDDEYHIAEPSIMPLRSGVDFSVEDRTEALLADDRRTARAQGQPVIADYLTPDQITLRHAREVIGPLGVTDPSMVHGIYRRAHNPMAGQRPTKLRQGDE